MKGSRVSGLSPWVGEEGSGGEGDQGRGGGGGLCSGLAEFEMLVLIQVEQSRSLGLRQNVCPGDGLGSPANRDICSRREGWPQLLERRGLRADPGRHCCQVRERRQSQE